MMPPLLKPPIFLRTVKINISLIYIVPPPTQKKTETKYTLYFF